MMTGKMRCLAAALATLTFRATPEASARVDAPGVAERLTLQAAGAGFVAPAAVSPEVPPVPPEVRTAPEDEARRKVLLQYLGARIMILEEQVSLEATAKAAQEAGKADLCLVWWQEGSMACPSPEARKKYDRGLAGRAGERNRQRFSAAEDTFLGMIYFSKLMMLDRELGGQVPRLVAEAFTLLMVRDATLVRLGAEGWMTEKAPSRALNPEGRSPEKAAEVASMRTALAMAVGQGDIRIFLRELSQGMSQSGARLDTDAGDVSAHGVRRRR